MRTVWGLVTVAAGFTLVCAPTRAVGEEPTLSILFGNLHSHTSYSDGSGTPDEAFRHARHVARLDFLAITEHNHKSAESGGGERADGLLIATRPELYTGPAASALIPAANRWTESGKFVALYGQEFSSISKGNHVNVFDVPKVITAGNGKFDELLAWIRDPQHHDTTGKPGIVQFNHPKLLDDASIEYGADDFADHAAWVREMGAVTCLIEVLNGPAMTRSAGNRAAEVMEADYLHYLNLGFRLAPSGDQDNHYFTWGTASDVRTAVLAPSLTKEAVLGAIRARHVYATEDKNLMVRARVNGRLMGDVFATAELPQAGSALSISVSISDADEPIASYEVDVFSDRVGGPAAEAPVETRSVETTAAAPEAVVTISGIPYTGPVQFVFLRVRQHDEDGGFDRAWTAPVWFEGTAGGGVDGPAAGAADGYIASRYSRKYHASAECPWATKIEDANRITGPEAARGRTLCATCAERLGR